MTRVLILSWSAYGGGRARALLALCQYLDASGFDLAVLTGERGWPADRLTAHHGLPLAGEWHRVNWDADPVDTIRAAVDAHDPDVVVSFDTILNTKARSVERPTVGYCRTQMAVGLDEYWAPSRAVADGFNAELAARGEPRCRPVYPVWYIDPLGDAPDGGPIDVIVHGRKANGVIERLNPDYNVLLANRFTYAELVGLYRQAKAFLFPRPERFEPLGLMPIEAAAHGCAVAVPSNSGVAEVYPDHAHDRPVDHVDELVGRDPPEPAVPESPTDPAARFEALAGGA